MTAMAFFFVAEYDSPAGKLAGNPDEGEDIEVVELTLKQALEWIDAGRIQDGKTIILLLLALRKGWLENP